MAEKTSSAPTLIVQHAVLLQRFFAQSVIIAVAELDSRLRITACNSCFSNMLNCPEDCVGQNISAFLTPASQGILPLPGRIDYMSMQLHFTTACSPSCEIFKTADEGYLILGNIDSSIAVKTLSTMTLLTNEMANMARDLHRKNKELEAAHEKIKILSGIMPICMYCKKVRDDKGYWNKIEKFIEEHSEAQISHGICDRCLEIYYPEDCE